ncbi:hypothetical protein Bca52824_039074 [Brassica carinata]|uniref:Pentatricopeptide repeat-containing protein n=1 Tax=Brassica carinata TaxID=52824 RepID=A0A8X7RT08_BRACI|nr:hypothetical protein Bca52824_039074 [Brassica carinata]
MACLFTKGNDFKGLWEFLRRVSRRKKKCCHHGVYNLFDEMSRRRRFCERGVLQDERVSLHQRSLQNAVTDNCRYGMQTGCRKAIRRRMWEANRMFREMLFRVFAPDVVTYNCLIDGCCKTNRIGRALELFEDMKKRECVPNQVTYNSFVKYYSVTNEIERGVEMMGHGVPGSSTNTPLIHALMVEAGLVPREYTYKLVLDALTSEGMMGT